MLYVVFFLSTLKCYTFQSTISMGKYQIIIIFRPFICFCIFLSITASPYSHASNRNYIAPGEWLNHGGDIYNRRYATGETKITPSTAKNFRLKWRFHAGRDITATPAIEKGLVYFPCWNGNIYALNVTDGSLIWQQNLQNLTGLEPTILFYNTTWIVSRTTPTIAGDKLIFGIYGPGFVVAVKKGNGELIWSTKLDDHPSSVVTMSGTYYNGKYYVGTSSQEAATATVENCCLFRGSFSSLDANTGKMLWKTYMLPDNGGKVGGYSGASVWGSSPSIDISRSHIYIATGNLYSVPPHIEQCQEEQNNSTTPTNPDKCVEPENHGNSILALDLDFGEIKWFRQLGGYDVWYFACINSSTPGCPPGPNMDADFGEAPMVLSVRANGTKKDIVVAIQKSGFGWALDRDNGNIFWSTEAGPGGLQGGGTWGAATDGKLVYTSIVNSNELNFTLAPSTKVTTGGGWVAMDAKTGKILWTTAVPNNGKSNIVTVANGVLLAGCFSPAGPVYAINTKNGKILWTYETGASVHGGMSVSKGCMFVGHGYKASEDWLNHGGKILNRRYADGETKISPETASSLSLRWRFEAGRDISATPAIYDGTVYFPSWKGNIYAVKSSDGCLVWQKNVQELTGLSVTVLPANVSTIVSRETPTIADDKLIIGICGPAVVIAVDRATGNLIWSARLDDHFASIVTMSGTYHNSENKQSYRGFYVGTSSLEELSSLENCCTFRGSLIKLNVQTGNHVYVATGNLYSVPQRIVECQEQQNNQTTPSDSDNCIEPDNHSNSILALDLDSGDIKWYEQLGGYDVWIVACSTPGTPNCPPGPNPDDDFGEAPMILRVNANGTTKDLLVAVQKSGFAWALYRDNGSLAWSTEAGPGGIGGGDSYR
ncbi:hypothetical protein Leryth_007787 [Lithospermum erythrorhizon]|nr:hypothetical protein Leryth_007787 [Lithospermum erythrorhizon]